MKGNKETGTGKRDLTIQDGYYVEILVSAAIACILGCLLWGKALLPLYVSMVPNWILVAVLFLSVTFLHVLITGLFERFLGRIYPRHEPLGIGRVLAFALCGSLIVGVMAGLLEFIYEMDFHKKTIPVPTGGVVYVIDDSGSMSGTDPQDKRNQCVIKMNECLDSKTLCGLVRFSDGVDLYVDMAPLDSGHKGIMAQCAMAKASKGGTDIESGIYKALEMCESSPAVRDASEKPHILLLTDGVSNCNEGAVIQRCLNDGIKIDAISLGVGTDLKLLGRLTSATGGTLANAPSALYLEGAFKVLIGQDVKRCLLTPVLLISGNRPHLRVMQVAFLLLIGLAMEAVVTLMLLYTRYVRKHIIKSPLVVLAGAFLVMLSDASLPATFLMLGCFLCPFFVGRRFQGFPKRQRVVCPKPTSGYRAGLIGRTERHYYCEK